MKTTSRILVCLWLLGQGTALWAGEPSAAGREARVLAALRNASAAVKTVSSNFVQEKHLAMFEEVVVSKGRFCFEKPEHLCWELTHPVRSGFSITGNRGKRWHEHMDRTESFDVARMPVLKKVAEQLLGWATADLDRMKNTYRITVLDETPISLRLEALDPMAREVVDHLVVVFAPDARHVRVVEVHEGDGDFTRITFTDASINTPLPTDFP